MAFVVCGLVAAASGVAMFKTDLDPDPKDAMALAPAETLIAPNAAQPATQSGKRPVNAPSAEESDEDRV
jgi:hypothetical protein